MTLQTHYSKKDRSLQYSYRCGGYASRVNSCTAHSISVDNVEALILSTVKEQRVSPHKKDRQTPSISKAISMLRNAFFSTNLSEGGLTTSR